VARSRIVRKVILRLFGKNERYYHTVTRCAQGFKGKPKALQNEAAKIVQLKARACYVEFIGYITNLGTHGNGGKIDLRASGSSGVEAPSRSRSPLLQFEENVIGKDNDVTNTAYLGKRIAKLFDGKVYYGTMTGENWGAMLAKQPDGSTQWHAVWKVVFDDVDSEEMNSYRSEIMAAMELYRINGSKDLQKPQAVDNRDVDDDISVGEDGLPDHGLHSSENDFLDPRYCLIDLPTPTAT
jgi:hypothetical protein